ncbi:hypothetical protein G7B40_023640 [Aetokthonos hydrillicola Thurmond2011]|jgi:hypothetical protein|uniref:Uncharacterized protein n=1 Tax=Aetokthonos hydrillicola Thurmond2011 TaxID=2712845 RepID=A0AAP5I9T2_9CYAN|nr:hypothetical protein [Aetokthonos hydrillicola]MBO3460256.1 hypothetical protein [Aetokthonos hydrillicola CCALA 1050]MBW4586989.1 hypothetical protein [Aetokthonos hydrillicola CCALA 1050]MDR9897536.1 hypothetical protein [Aetokthonos hydrillicola Thurmond2011]
MKFRLCQLILGLLGICSLLNQSVEAVQPQKVRSYCRQGESTFLAVETKSFWVSICGGDLPHTYVGVNKKTRQSLRLPLKNADRYYFDAVNGDYLYILADSTKGKNLTVTRGTRELLREPVIKGW